MPHGGKRPGAGRPAKAKVALGEFKDPRALLEAIMASDACDTALRARVALGLLQLELAEGKFRAQLFTEGELERWPPNPAVGVAKTS